MRISTKWAIAMFNSVTDSRAGIIVGVYSTPVIDDDHARSIESIAASDRNASERNIPHVCVLVTYRGMAEPSPLWRKRMADANNAMKAEAYYFALVAPSMLHRNVFTAIKWLTRHRAGHQMHACKDFAAAVEWIRRESGGSHPSLESLHERVQRMGARPRIGQSLVRG